MGRKFSIIKYRKTITETRLPSEYQEVSFLQSTGLQYIDTDVKVNSLTLPHIKTKFQALSSSDVDYFGAGNSGDNNIIWNFVYPSTAYIRWGSTSSLGLTYESGKSIADFNCLTQPKTLEIITTDTATGNYYVDGEKIATSTGIGFNADLPILINNARGNKAKARWYTFQIYDGDTLIRDYVPCYKINELTTGMYDLVTNTFYLSMGTEFITGPSIIHYEAVETIIEQPASGGTNHNLPSAYQEVSYLETNGKNNYIDTGVVINQTTIQDIIITLDVNMYMGSGNGANGKDNTEYLFLGMQPDGKAYTYLGGSSGNYQFRDTVVTSGSRHTYKINTSEKTLYRDNEVINVFTSNLGTSNFNASNFYLGAVSKRTDADYYVKEKIYSCQITQNGTLVRNLIPCYRKSDYRPGLYDLANNVFYNNGGTAEDFFIGPSLNPKFRLIEYNTGGNS